MALSCPDCASGVLHGGIPTGTITTMYGLSTYVAEPDDGRSKAIVVILTDAFGWDLVNNRVLADSYAKKGSFKVIMPDFFNGTAISSTLLADVETALGSSPSPSSSSSSSSKTPPSILAKITSFLRIIYHAVPFMFWNRAAVAGPKVYAFFHSLRADTPPDTKIGAAGFCWGGLWTTSLSKPPSITQKTGYWPTSSTSTPSFFIKEDKCLINAAYAAHPSFISASDLAATRIPYSVAHASEDHGINKKDALEMARVLNDQRENAEWIVYDGARHGFAIRSDPSDAHATQQGLDAEEQAIRWFTRYLTS